ncbi:GNAT family N-acetyltransferase [Calidifontibacter sp. DB0510]|uniref:GNAT family N-acetyltransferase n=1 Tax=Metallococcus carri TaxID=1656884 RepID=A0A967AXB6_9MICO|nr:GNAT family N-acetyltransferase [Metallococcus carri]NHN54696.1 GNAT family N-acetyltransferase [Metallococcus carri]NOP37041.1 GNAT family N-acetyltransferase [Calidifontibacter sp. DB2511S]
MSISLHTPTVEDLATVITAVAEWQIEGGPVQLHPGDIGWNQRDGAEAIAAALRTWTRDGRIVAVAMTDGDVARIAAAPDLWEDDDLAAAMTADLADPDRGVLTAGGGAVEARFGGALSRHLTEAGWTEDEPWTPLHRSLAAPVEDSGLRIEIVGPDDAQLRVDVHKASFDTSTFTLAKWRAMAAGPAYADARCLLGYAGEDAVAAATVWSAGEGRPGLIEPLGGHRDFRGKGYGRGITHAAAAALREMGASSVTVCTPSANTRGVAAYVSAGFTRLPDWRDLRRP